MSSMSRLRATVLAAVLYSCLPVVAFAAPQIEFLIDVSGSMNEKGGGGERQIDSARSALLNALKEVPTTTQVALRAYGHRVAKENKAESCRDTELLIPFGQGGRDDFETSLSLLQPKGYTPIAYSLESAKGDFSVEAEGDRTIILLTDGKETCGGDPLQAVKNLRANGLNVRIHTVGFNVDEDTRKQLRDIAALGEGKYFDAAGATQLRTALRDAAKEAVTIDKSKSVYGRPVRGGDSYETAVPLEVGQEFRLDHHQKEGEFDYFYVDLKGSEGLHLVLTTLERGLQVNSSTQKLEESNYCYATLSFVDSNRSEQVELHSSTCRHREERTFSGPTGRYYILVGDRNMPMHAEHVSFQITKEILGDVGLEGDAGNSFDLATPIKEGKYPGNYLNGGDPDDFYVFQAKKGENVVVSATQLDGSPVCMLLSVHDQDYVEVDHEGLSPSGKIKFTADESGPYYIRVAITCNQKYSASYAFTLRKEGSKEGAQTDGE